MYPWPVAFGGVSAIGIVLIRDVPMGWISITCDRGRGLNFRVKFLGGVMVKFFRWG